MPPTVPRASPHVSAGITLIPSLMFPVTVDWRDLCPNDKKAKPVALFRPYERKTEGAERTPQRRTRLVPESESAKTRPTKATPAASGDAGQEPGQESPATASPASSGKVQVARRRPVRKTEPTMTRKQAEAARMARLHPTLSPKEQRQADREARLKERTQAWDRLEASEERTLARDFVDARWTITEFMLPAMILIMAAGMALINSPALSTTIMLGLWVLLILSMINTWIMWRSFKRLLLQRVPGAQLRGLLMYMYNRALLIRRFRRPAPRIKRGEAV